MKIIRWKFQVGTVRLKTVRRINELIEWLIDKDNGERVLYVYKGYINNTSKSRWQMISEGNSNGMGGDGKF